MGTRTIFENVLIFMRPGTVCVRFFGFIEMEKEVVLRMVPFIYIIAFLSA